MRAKFTNCIDSGTGLSEETNSRGVLLEPDPSAGIPLRQLLAGGAFAALLIVGTGGSMTLDLPTASNFIRSEGGTGSACRVQYASISPLEDCEHRTARSTEALAYIQHHLSLNISALATVLRISRPTVYSWFRDESQLHTHNASRVAQLYEIAQCWCEMSSTELGPYLKRPLPQGGTIFDILSAEALLPLSIQRGLQTCAQMMNREAESPRPRTATEIAKQFGLRSPSPEMQEESLAQETGL